LLFRDGPYHRFDYVYHEIIITVFKHIFPILSSHVNSNYFG
jgi:hypothetical protein